MTRIVAVRCALPPHRHSQAELTAMFCELSDMEPGRRTLLERLHANAGVDTRHTVLPLAEYGELDGIGPTNDLYIERATTLGEQAIRSLPPGRGGGARPARRHQALANIRAWLRRRRGWPRAAARLPARLATAHRRPAGGRTVLADPPRHSEHYGRSGGQRPFWRGGGAG